MEIIGARTNFISLSQNSLYFGHSNNKDTTYFQPVIAVLHGKQNIVCELSRRIGHNYDSSIFRGPNLIPPSLRRNMK